MHCFTRAGFDLAAQVDHDLAVEQADALHAARVQKFIGTDHDVFLEILGKQSRAQIQVRFLGAVPLKGC